MKWDKKETIKLENLYRDGIPIQRIADRLNKSPGAIEGKLRLLGIKRNRFVPRLRLPSKILLP